VTILVLSLVPALALVSYSFLLYLTWRQGLDDKVNLRFAIYLFSMMLWSLGALMMYLDRSNASTWNKVMLAGTILMPLAFFSFVHAFLNLHRYKHLLQAGVILSIIFLVLDVLGYMAGDIHITEQGLIEFSLGPAIPFFGIYYALFLGLGIFSLVRRLRNTRDYMVRNRIQYVLLGLIIVILGGITNTIGNLGSYPIDIATNFFNAFLIAYAISRYNLLDIKFVIRKGLLYSIPTIIVATTYFLAIYLAVNLFHLVAGYEVLLMSLVVAAIVGLVLQPTRDSTQQWVDRLFFREKFDSTLMLQRLSTTASSVLDIDKLASMILHEINDTIHVTKAALFLKEPGAYFLVDHLGIDTNMKIPEDSPIVQWLSIESTILTRHTLEILPQFMGLWDQERKDLDNMEAELLIPLIVRGELIGILMLGPKRSEEPYTNDDRLTLMTLANQTAIAMQNAWLYQTAIDEKERTEIILHQAFAGIMVVDQDLRITSVNPGAEQITGYGAQELLGRLFTDVFEPVLWNEYSALNKAITTDASVAPVETVLVGKDDSRDILLGVTPISDGLLLNFTDITELKEVERLKSNIVDNVSHELRTPLASIKGYTELLLDGYEGQDTHLRHQFLSIINDETDRLTKFITDLLDLSRLESGQAEPHKEFLFLNRIVDESLRTLVIQSKKAGVEIHIDSPDDVPLILANRDLMTSLVKNLVSNAIKYSRSGGQVDVIVRQDGNSLVLSISDQGLGIPSQDIPYLFTKFYRARSAQRSDIGGTGLGLALAKEAVEVHYGTISVESEVGVGTRFIVTLPIPEQDLSPVEDGYVVPQTAG